MKRMIVHGQKEMLQVAVVDGNRLIEFYMEKTDNAVHLVGSVFKGRIVNVLPGMQAAFVDIGLSKNAFLYIDDSCIRTLNVSQQLSQQLNSC